MTNPHPLTEVEVTQADERLALAISLAFNVPSAEQRNLAKYLARHRIEHSTPDRNAVDEVRVVFDGPPGHESGRFVECENAAGHSINAGEWHERPDGFWELRILALTTTPEPTDPAGVSELVERLRADGKAGVGAALDWSAEECATYWARQCQKARTNAKEAADLIERLARTPDPVLEVAKLDEIDLFRIIRAAGRSNASKAKAVFVALQTINERSNHD